ncbi:MAG: tRNA (N(6)-L-threonylcarbamoyladenosine(37)-C(2))-methylthiotransferase MtaB [Sphingomonadales bacterium]|nr:tRNA (N(6)-L-threonylcarbamoyladenosine(37)-C(2))-methylthiotransferase MtaB [Sphingomonadales bacterium]
MAKPQIITFGCRLNSFESEVMRRHAEDNDLDGTIIINTCAVTAEATRQARQTIRKLKREQPDAKIIVTGCAAQIEPETFANMPETSMVLGNVEKMQAESYAGLDKLDADLNAGLPVHEKIKVNDIMSVKETAGHMVDGLKGRSRAFVQIQNGCDHRCTFCIIPYGRGNSRSVPMGQIVKQIKALVDNGYNEVVLTGVDVTSFGADLPGKPSLGHCVATILKQVPDLPRLRLSSIDSVEIDEKLLELIINEKRLMPHLHLSLQAGDNMILKRMKRRHSREDAIAFSQMIMKARPDMVFGADIIAGFPTETDEMFENSLKLIEDCNLTYMHVFPYSPREGTPAAKMPQVAKQIRKERAKLLREAGEAAMDKLLDKLQGTIQSVLIERPIGDGVVLGHSEGFAPVKIDEALETGQIVKVHITGQEDGMLKGSIIND